MSIEAMKQALEAFSSDRVHLQIKAKVALRQAIEQAQKQEPLTGGDERRHIICLCPTCIKPRTPASLWVELTDVEWMNIVNKDHAWFGQRPEDVAHEVAKLVKAKLKEKNT